MPFNDHTFLNNIFSRLIFTAVIAVLISPVISGLNAQNPLNVQIDTVPDQEAVRVRVSKDALEATVNYKCVDTQWIDMKKKEIHLVGDAEVTYQDIQLNADYIIFSFETNIVTARGLPDSSGVLAGKPKFKQGSQAFDATEMKYNFKTKKGLSLENVAQEGDLYVLTERAKFHGQINEDEPNKIFGRGSIITTCNHPVPHYGIRSNKQKIIPDKTLVVGPSNVEIAGVPTPIWLPFGFFPITTKRKAGIVFSLDYDYNDNFGYGLRGIGYFMPLNEYANLSILGDIYTRGSYRITTKSDYRKLYRYNGGFSFTWSDYVNESPDATSTFRERLYEISLNHTQDPKANPFHNFSGRLHYQSPAFARRNFYDANSQFTNTVSSSLNYLRSWTGVQFNAGISHSQNLRNGNIRIVFPDMGLTVQRIQPFKKEGSVRRQWYEEIGLSYIANLQSELSGNDSTFFSRETFNKIRPGMRQRITLNSNLTLLKFFNLSPSVNYVEYWNYNTLRRTNNQIPTIRLDTIYNADSSILKINQDTLSYGSVIESYAKDFRTWRSFSMGINMNTAIFGTLRFRKGWLRGLRHTMKPTISLDYSPSTLNMPWFDEYPRGRSRNFDDLQRYSYFDQGAFSSPTYSKGSLLLNYSLNNIFEAKYKSDRDSTIKKMNLFDNIFVGGNYNFLADTLNWSPIRISGGTNLFQRMSRIDIGAGFDVYSQDSTGKSIQRFYWNEKRKLVRFVNANMRMTTNLSVGKIKEWIGLENENGDFLSLFETFNLQHNIVLDLRPINGKDTLVIVTHTINTMGKIRITNKWEIGIGNIGYDFRAKSITYPAFDIIRDLHCWEMIFGWFPEIGAYTFMIKVKPSTLDFIKIPYRRNAVGNFSGFGF